MHTQPTSSLSKWLPSRGSVLFTLIVAAGMLMYAQRAGAFPTTQTQTPSTTSTNTLPYQGRLTDANGAPLNGTYSMSFQLYNTASGGSALWSEEWDFADSVVVTNGLFNVILGSLTPIPQSVITGNSSLWLGISIETDSEMTPRVQVGSVPFAFQANRANGLAAADGDPQDAVVVDASGNVGIGTTGTNNKLNVFGNLEVGGGSRGMILNSSVADNFSLYTYTNTPNPNFTIGYGDGNGSIDFSKEYITANGGHIVFMNAKIGIGTTNPTQMLQVGRADLSNGVSDGQIVLGKTDAVGARRLYKIGLDDSYKLSIGDYGYSGNEIYTPIITLATGYVGIGTTNPTQPLEMGSGAHVTVGGMWTNASDRNLKENFVSIDALSLLEKVAQLPLSIWNYKTEGSEISHIGPMAQDFYAAFGVGEDDQHIGTVDANGVALAAIQGLYQLTQDQQTQIETQQATLTQLTTDNAALQDQVAGLDERLGALEEAVRSGQPVQAGGQSASSWGMLLLGAVVGAGILVGLRISKRFGFPIPR